jgi:hypothetical protein
MKRCPDCGQYKPLSEFPRNRRMRDGRHAYCKPCHNARGKETKQRLYGAVATITNLRKGRPRARRPRSCDGSGSRHPVLQLQRRTRAVRRRHRTTRSCPALSRVVGHESGRADAFVGARSRAGARVAGEGDLGFLRGVSAVLRAGVPAEADAGAQCAGVSRRSDRSAASAVSRRAQSHGRRARGAPVAATIAILAPATARSLRIRPSRLALR